MNQSKLLEVSSQNIAKIGYSQPEKKLYVVFTNSPTFVYAYEQVPPSVYSTFKASSSLGSFFANNIKEAYTFKRLPLTSLPK